jgi:hypothetical protein
VVVEIDALCLTTPAIPPKDQPPLIVDPDRNVGAYCLALTKVHMFGPAFRAESLKIGRHRGEAGPQLLLSQGRFCYYD